jgi:hypothetical protein
MSVVDIFELPLKSGFRKDKLLSSDSQRLVWEVEA